MPDKQNEEFSGSDFGGRRRSSGGIQPPIFVAIMLLFLILYPSMVDNSNQLLDIDNDPNDPNPPIDNNSTNPIEPIDPSENNTSNNTANGTTNNTNTTNPHTPSEYDADGDGWADIIEQACHSNPYDNNSIPEDRDGDGICDSASLPESLPGPGEEPDSDGDGWADWREEQCDSDFNDLNQTPLIAQQLNESENDSILSDRGLLYTSALMEFTERLINRSSFIGSSIPVHFIVGYRAETNLERYIRSTNLTVNIITGLEKTEQICSFGAPNIIANQSLDQSWYNENSSFGNGSEAVFRWQFLSITIYDTQPILHRLIAARERGEIEAFWINPIRSSNQASQPMYTPNDEYYSKQWHLDNTGGFPSYGTSGEDLNITSIWNSFTGSGTHIHLIDTGIDVDHEEFENLNLIDSINWCEVGNDPNPVVFPSFINNSLLDNDTQAIFDAYHERIGHGTSAVGISSAKTNNVVGISGIAFDANFSVGKMLLCPYLEEGDNDTIRAQALTYNLSGIDIYSNSWGTKPFANDTARTLSSLKNGSLDGREGKGAVYVFAAGNSRDNGSLSTYNPLPNSRFSISVCAVNRDGGLAHHSELGANLLICGYSDGIYTTDHSGYYGYDNDSDYNPFFSGTSAAAPQISGIIALMLEANPNLTWRDVQHVLVQSSRMNSPTDESWLISNSTGLNFSHKFGYGIGDAGRAVELALNWTNVEDEITSTYSLGGLNRTIVDGSNYWHYTPILVNEFMSLESVELSLNVEHQRHGDLEVNLISPSGRTSVLSALYNPQDHDLNHTKNGSLDWTFTSVAHWGEDSSGYWFIKIRDALSGPDNNTSVGGILKSWNLTIHGHIGLDSDGDGWHDSDEVDCGTSRFHDSSIPLDSDGDGICNTLEFDDDNDGFNDWNELICGSDPLDSSSIAIDTDGGQLCDGLDNDDDNDYILDWNDYFPLNLDEWFDYDSDGIGDVADLDDDGDGITDTDSDGDDIGDNADAFPNNSDEWADFDGDGIGDNEDTDDDNDGMPDSADSAPRDSSISTPWFWESSWFDIDGDMIPDHIDANPTNSNYGVNPAWFTDLDGDGVPNWADQDYHNGGSDWIGNHLGLFQRYFPISDRSDYGGEPAEPPRPN